MLQIIYLIFLYIVSRIFLGKGIANFIFVVSFVAVLIYFYVVHEANKPDKNDSGDSDDFSDGSGGMG